jgi:MFS transporter, putative metabolite:H+ symporter
MFADRKSSALFWTGSLFVVAGVLLHIPMLMMARHMHFVLAGMPMGNGMLAGMGFIIAGSVAAAYGLQPKDASLDKVTPHQRIIPPEDSPLTPWHWIAGGALAVALVIDIMKPATLGFVTPGMTVEYHVSKATVAYLPFGALAGLTIGSFIWGALADL